MKAFPSRGGLLAVILVSLVLAACAQPTVERYELRAVERGEADLVHALVDQLHAAMSALQAAVSGDPGLAALGLRMDQVVVSLYTLHTDAADGGFLLLLAGGEEDDSGTAGNLIQFTLSVDDDTVSADHTTAAGQVAAAPDCAAPLEFAQTADEEGADISAEIVTAVLAAIDGYRCALDPAAHPILTLDQLSVTLTIDTVRTETEGLQFALGPVTLGDKLSQTAENKTTIQIHFKRPSD